MIVWMTTTIDKDMHDPKIRFHHTEKAALWHLEREAKHWDRKPLTKCLNPYRIEIGPRSLKTEVIWCLNHYVDHMKELMEVEYEPLEKKGDV